MRIAIRTDASSQIGTGHFMRCLTLADGLKERGAKIRFVSRYLPEYLRSMLVKKSHEFVSLDSTQNDMSVDGLAHAHWLGVSQVQDATDTILILSDETWDWLIVDHYALDVRWETMLRQTASKILVIDDIADRQHDCDMLLDQNAHKNASNRYDGKVPSNCIKFLGPRFAILRKEFQAAKNQLKRQQGAIKRIIVAFGGADTTETINVLNMLEKTKFLDIDVDVVIAFGHPKKDEISFLCSLHPNWYLHYAAKNMAMLMANADVAIGAGGIITWERIYLGLPAFVKVVAGNQAEAMGYLSSSGQIIIWKDIAELDYLLEKHLTSGVALPSFDVGYGTDEIADRISLHASPTT